MKGCRAEFKRTGVIRDDEGTAMKFVMVNHEPPSRDSACSACARPLRSGYVRHVRTQRRYCGYDCYRQHQLGTSLMSWPLSQLWTAPAPKSIAASRRIAVEAIALSSAIAYWSFTAQMWAVSQSLTQAFLSARDLMTLR